MLLNTFQASVQKNSDSFFGTLRNNIYIHIYDMHVVYFMYMLCVRVWVLIGSLITLNSHIVYKTYKNYPAQFNSISLLHFISLASGLGFCGGPCWSSGRGTNRVSPSVQSAPPSAAAGGISRVHCGRAGDCVISCLPLDLEQFQTLQKNYGKLHQDVLQFQKNQTNLERKFSYDL